MYIKKNNKRKILFISPGAHSDTTPFVSGIKKVSQFNSDVIYTKPNSSDYYANKKSILFRILSKLRVPYDQYNINKRLINKISKNEYDYLFIIKGNLIKPNTLKKVKEISPKIKIISWSSDDMMQAHNSSYYYLSCIKHFDLIVTTKSFNTLNNKLQIYGAKKILFQDNAYVKTIHRPFIKKKLIKKKTILFIGYAEKERFRSMNFLAKNGIKVKIYGSGWDKNFYKKNAHYNLNINFRNLEKHKYSEALSNAYISLCFLRKINRDAQTARSVEIPACGGLMLAERTNEHLRMFEEWKEAVYFSSDKELLEKINYLMKNKRVRDKIAKNGYKKCKYQKMSYNDRLKTILKNC